MSARPAKRQVAVADLVSAIPDCIDLIGGPRIDVVASVGAWRPPQT